jgi:universal stress protein E
VKYAMQRFKNILLVIDGNGNDVALERGVALSRRNRARLTVVNVVKEAPRTADIPAADAQEFMGNATHEIHLSSVSKSAVLVYEYIVEEKRRQLAQSVTAVRQAGVQVDHKLLYGTPFLAIIQEVLRNEHDLVIIAAEGQGGLKEMLFGNTTMRLMRKCPCPVWVLKPTHPKQYGRILAAVDPAPFDQERDALNTKIMDLATSLACLEHSELHILHTWLVYGESILRRWHGRFQMPAGEVDKLTDKTRDEHRRWLDELLRRYALDNLTCRVHLLKGEADQLIPQLVGERKIELIVMGTMCRTKVAGLLIGSTAENVLRQVNCSVLTIKPDGFISPVKLGK